MGRPINGSELVAALIASRSESEALPVRVAYSLSLDIKKYNDMIREVKKQALKAENPQVFWDNLPEQLSNQHLNDVEAFVYGVIVMATLVALGGSVIWGREAAEKNGVDYDQFLKDRIKNDMERRLEN